MRRLALLLLLTSACSSATPSTSAPPDLSPAASIDLQARAVVASCFEAGCPGAPIYLLDTTDPDVFSAVVAMLGDEIRLISAIEAQQLLNEESRLRDGGMVVSLELPIERFDDDVVGVSVFRSGGSFDGLGKTYLYRWDGVGWIETTQQETGATVTTSVP